MKIALFLICLLFATVSSAAEVTTSGMDLTPFQKKAVETVLEKEFPGSEAEVRLLTDAAYPSLSSVKLTVLHEGTVKQATVPGFGPNSAFDGILEAIEKIASNKE